ncbi:unnamed protein product, partial [Hymenolepis diminuta]|uniref:Ovule protein n=1 Tax=Hymenolepis diminuta TaxID=6216 RepID=A0A0R3SP02_HYMDI
GKRSALDKKIIEPAEVVVVDESDDGESSVAFVSESSVAAVTVSASCATDKLFPKTAKANKIKNRRRCILLPLRMTLCCFQSQSGFI